MPDRLRIVVVDDHALVRAGVVQTLQMGGMAEIVAEGATGAEAVELALLHAPDIVLLDISMPGGGIEAARQIARKRPDVKIVMLTVSEDSDQIMQALEAGARGYVLKGVSTAELVSVVQMVGSGGSYVSPALAGRLLLAMTGKGKPASPTEAMSRLSSREEEILRLVALGLSNREVGRKLGLQEKTVKHYMTNVLQKLQVRNRTEAAVVARELWAKREA